ncbi:MAG: hydroxymethylbilane synthase [Bacteroidia bacterium]|jgi:hydroxymethylbilane synthase
MKGVIKIGTRDSALALWQAEYIKSLVEEKGEKAELVHIKSEGEIDLVRPLYEIGVQGIFTKTLDSALLNGKIDIAVHSLKDVPTQVPEGLIFAATPKRGPHADLLIYKNLAPDASAEIPYTVATSSLRRRAQWLNRYPHHVLEPIRGNINSRIQKLNTTMHWDATVMAAAGVDRIQLNIPNRITLDWMLPAPAQGALGIFCRNNDHAILELCSAMNDADTQKATLAERQFLRTLMGGCTMPIAAFAYIEKDTLHLHGNVLTIDGKQKAEIAVSAPASDEPQSVGEKAALQLLDQGGREILHILKSK